MVIFSILIDPNIQPSLPKFQKIVKIIIHESHENNDKIKLIDSSFMG